MPDAVGLENIVGFTHEVKSCVETVASWRGGAQEGALVCDGGWSRYPAEACASRCEKFTAHQERRCDAEELEQAAGGWQPNSAQGLGGFQAVLTGRAKESSLQSGDQLTLWR